MFNSIVHFTELGKQNICIVLKKQVMKYSFLVPSLKHSKQCLLLLMLMKYLHYITYQWPLSTSQSFIIKMSLLNLKLNWGSSNIFATEFVFRLCVAHKWHCDELSFTASVFTFDAANHMKRK